MIEPPELNAADVARTFRVLRKLDPDSVTELKKRLRGDLKQTAKAIASKYPSNPALSGFQQTYGRWGWGRVVGKVSVTPGRSRKGAGRKNVVSLQMTHDGATPWVMEMIGSNGGNSIGRYSRRNSRYRAPYGQGPALLRAVNRRFPAWPNGGRIFYSEFQDRWKSVYGIAEGIINRWSEKVSRELS